ncbi:MAG: hypothetical protein RLZ62_1617 [Bacteroidota bacterium]|jgi:hypothetical protein
MLSSAKRRRGGELVTANPVFFIIRVNFGVRPQDLPYFDLINDRIINFALRYRFHKLLRQK